tara:strand:- start:64871 stop:65446 length:576 start_codon:yes stop_codon:yes gene_type:complete
MKAPRYNIDLVRQMADCDANFIRLLKLMPELESFREAFLLDAQGLACAGREEPVLQRFPQCENAPLQVGEAGLQYAREFVISSTASEEVRVRISVLEVFPYTSTLAINQLTRVSQWIDPPGILVRVYHDATTAEAVAYQGHKAFLAKYAIPNPTMYHQDEKRQINEFLGEWLSLCLQAGHSLKPPSFICAA